MWKQKTFILDHLRLGTLGLGPPFSALWALAPLLHFSLLYHALPILPRTAHRYLELKAHRMSLQHLETRPVEGKSCQIRWHKVFLVCSQGSLDVQTQHVQQLACLPARYVNTIQHICQHNSCSRPTCDSDGMPASKVLWHQSGRRGVSATSSTLWRVTSLQYPGVTPQLSHMALQCATVCHGDWMKDD